MMEPSIHYKISGEGHPFIFQHGLGSNIAQPQSLLAGLKGYQLISMDCPGHGNTPLRLGLLPSFNNYADEIIRLMNCLGIENAIFGGISMGAGISLNIALRYPQSVKALVLIRPAWLAKKNPENLKILKVAAGFIGKKNGKGNFTQRADYQSIKNNLPTAAKSVLGVFASNQQTAMPLVLKKMVGDRPFKRIEELAKINVPCLILGNENDPLHPLEMAQTIHQNIKGSQINTITSRYIKNRQYKIEVNESVHSFLSALPS